MSDSYQLTAEKTYRAIGRFIFEFSQVEYTIRYYLAQEIGLHDDHFSAVVQSYDVALLCRVSREVFAKSCANSNAAAINDLIGKFLALNDERNCLAHGLWVPFKDGGTVHYVSRSKLKPNMAANRAAALEKLADAACALRSKLENEFTSVGNF